MRYLVGIFPILYLATAAADSGTDRSDDLVSRVRTSVAARDELLSDFELLVDIRETAAEENSGYWKAHDQYQEHVAHFFGVEPKPPRSLDQTHVTPSPTEYWRMLRNVQNEMRLDFFYDVPNETLTNIQYSECLRPTHWERISPFGESGTLVNLSQASVGVEAMGVLGFSYPDRFITNVPLADLLVEARDTGALVTAELRQSSIYGEVFVFAFLTPHKSFPGVFDRHEVEFSSQFGFAPIAISTEWCVRENGKVRPVEVGRGSVVRWEEFEIERPGLYVAHKLTVTRYADVMLPKSPSTGFTPLMKNGRKVMDGPRPVPHPLSYVVKRFTLGAETHAVRSLDVSPQLPHPLCDDKYPAGTIVQDEATGEVFQLTGSTHAVDTAMRNQLEPVWSQQEAAGRQSNAYLILLFSMIPILVITLMWWRKRIRSAANQLLR